jgi:hypothetical protein
LKLLITIFLVSVALSQMNAQTCSTSRDSMIVASKLHAPLDAAGFPVATEWRSVTPIVFCDDWQGRNPDPVRQTEVRVLWSAENLYLQFRASYRSLYTFPNGNRRQDELWTRDVAETFLQPPDQSGHRYAEFEISPNGDWLDLGINGNQKSDLNCAMKSRVKIDRSGQRWIAELAIPISTITSHFDPTLPWRANFFRVEGLEPNRFYSSWQPTNTLEPNFHVPQVFGTLEFTP